MITACFATVLFVNLACALNFAFGVYSLYQNRVLSKLPSIREVHNRLRAQTNELRGENARLNRSVYRLDRNVARMEEVEGELAAIASNGGTNVRRLIEVVDEQRRINREMEEKLKAEVLQTIVGAVMRSDGNRDFQLAPLEMESLVIRLGLIEGVGFDENKFRRELRRSNQGSANYSLGAIMSVLRNLMEGSRGMVGQQDAIFNVRVRPANDS